MIFDVGAKKGGYASDITRTLVAGGLDKADETFHRIYSVVRQAQLEASANIKAGHDRPGGRRPGPVRSSLRPVSAKGSDIPWVMGWGL